MNTKSFSYRALLALVFIYWLAATIHLFSDTGGDNLFLLPGCIIGFALGYDSNLGAIVGQVITLIILLVIIRVGTAFISKHSN